ncbi:MAG: hypothetical protein V4563_14890 [Pseudomonadota bacterium]
MKNQTQFALCPLVPRSSRSRSLTGRAWGLSLNSMNAKQNHKLLLKAARNAVEWFAENYTEGQSSDVDCIVSDLNHAIDKAKLAGKTFVALAESVLELDTPPEDMGGDWGTVEWSEQVGHVIEQAEAAIGKTKTLSR